MTIAGRGTRGFVEFFIEFNPIVVVDVAIAVKIGTNRAYERAAGVHDQPLRSVVADVLIVVHTIVIDVGVAFVRYSILITVIDIRISIARDSVKWAIFLSVTAHAVPGIDVALRIGCARRGRAGPGAVETRAQLRPVWEQRTVVAVVSDGVAITVFLTRIKAVNALFIAVMQSVGQRAVVAIVADVIVVVVLLSEVRTVKEATVMIRIPRFAVVATVSNVVAIHVVKERAGVGQVRHAGLDNHTGIVLVVITPRRSLSFVDVVWLAARRGLASTREPGARATRTDQQALERSAATNRIRVMATIHIGSTFSHGQTAGLHIAATCRTGPAGCAAGRAAITGRLILTNAACKTATFQRAYRLGSTGRAAHVIAAEDVDIDANSTRQGARFKSPAIRNVSLFDPTGAASLRRRTLLANSGAGLVATGVRSYGCREAHGGRPGKGDRDHQAIRSVFH